MLCHKSGQALEDGVGGGGMEENVSPLRVMNP